MKPIEVLTLVLPQAPAPEDVPIVVGAPKLYWRGEELPFPVTDGVRVDMGRGKIMTATITVPVVIVLEEPT